METRERILELLEQHRGSSLSGERIAEALQVSRTAVWKAIRELRAAGYLIDASTRRGYCLSDANDILSAAAIRPFLSESCQQYADRIRVYDVLPSTNQTAKEQALSGAGHGTVILANRQSAGRGRKGRAFFSPPGGLYMSVVLKPDALPFDQVTCVTAFAAVAVCEALRETAGVSPGIKWVNDIQLDGKKVCGILTEAVTDFESGGLDWIVVGLGVNLGVRAEDFPPELQSIAASVDPEGSIPSLRNRLCAAILNRLLSGDVPDQPQMLRRYRELLRTLGRPVTVIQGDTQYPATALDIDGAGHLLVEKADGTRAVLTSGEVSIRT